jgi:hypothetical protein
MRWGIKVVAALVLGLCLTPAHALAAAPANDDFANRTVLSPGLPISESGTNEGATSEPGESVTGFDAGRSVWFEWIAPKGVWYTVGVCQSNFAASIGIFTGTEVGNLTPVVAGSEAEGPDCINRRQFTFHAVPATHYLIRVDGQSVPTPEGPSPPNAGSFSLRIAETPPPPNDAFANAAPLEGSIAEEPGGGRFYAAFAHGYNWEATSEPGEFTFGSGPVSSVWYRWKAPESGMYRLVGPCCGGLHWGLFSGGSFGAGDEMVAATGSAEVDVVGGSEYWIDVYGGLESGMSEPRMGAFNFFISATLPSRETEMRNPFEPVPRPADTTAPDTRVDKSQLRAATRSAKFWFSASEAVSGFECRLDKKDFKPCGSPRAYKHLEPGRHAFRVRAVDAAGNVDPSAAVAKFKIPKPSRGRR